MKKKRYKSIEQIKSRYGYMFISIWIIGFVVFFVIPVFQSLWYSFSDITLSTEGVIANFIGIQNYYSILVTDPEYGKNLIEAITSFLYSLPIILMISLVLALILNQKFKGRLFFRALYFLPVIIASGIVIKLMFQTTEDDLISSGVTTSLTDSMFSIEDVIVWLNLPDNIAVYVKNIINNIFDLVWSCGIQTVLFIAGLQSVPLSLYEASKVEGATKWQEFWFITFPMLSSVTLLVAVFTTVDLFSNIRNILIDKAYTMMYSGIYDVSSSMLWFYFLVVGTIMGLILLMYNRLLLKRWQ